MKTVFFLFVLLAHATSFAQVYVSERKITLPTYPFSDPDPVPAAKETRFPYFRFDRSSAKPVDGDFRLITVSNEFVAVDLMPEVGGKIWGARDLKSGFDFLYRNRSAKFRNIAMRGPWWSGGIEYNFGIIGHSPCTSTPVDVCVRTNGDGSVSCFVAMTEFICRTSYQVEIRLGENDKSFTTATTWYNASGLPAPYYHWMNAACPVRADMKLMFDGKNEIGHQGDAAPWPTDAESRRLDIYAQNAFGHNKSYHVINGDNRVFGAWYPSEGIGFLHENAGCDKYGRKAWLWALSREGAIWEDLLTDRDGQYVELQSGRAFNQPRCRTVLTPFKHPTFSPGRTDAFSERWGVVRSESEFAPKGKNPPSAAKPRPVVSPAAFDWASAYGHYLRGQQALREREDRKGEAELKLSLSREPDFVPALAEYAFLEIRRGRYGQAARLSERALGVDTYDGAANYAAGFASFASGDLATAKERLGIASYDALYRIGAWNLLARIAIAERDFAAAEDLLARVLDADRLNREALHAHVVARRLAGDVSGVRKAAARALALWPLHFAVMYEQSLVFGENGWFGKIRNEFPEETVLEISSWYRETGLEGDARALEALLAKNPLALVRRGEYEAASVLPPPAVFPFRREDVALLDRAVRSHSSWKFKYYRAVLAVSFDDDAYAGKLLDECGNEPDDYAFYLFRASMRNGDLRLADLRRAEKLSSNWRIGAALAGYFAELGDYGRSADEALKFLKINAGCNQLEIAYARALNGEKRWRECVEFLKGVNILPSEFGDNACDLWQEAWRNLGDLEKAGSYPEHLGKGAPYPDVPVASAAFGGSEIRLYAAKLAVEIVKGGKTVLSKTRVDVVVGGESVADERFLGKVTTSKTGQSETIADFASFAVRLAARKGEVAYRIEPKRKTPADTDSPQWQTFKFPDGL